MILLVFATLVFKTCMTVCNNRMSWVKFSNRSRTRLRSSSSSRQSSPPDDQPRCSKTNENAGGSRLDRSSDQSLTSARKSSSKKRKITDINSILLMKQQEQEMEKEQEQELERWGLNFKRIRIFEWLRFQEVFNAVISLFF